MTINTNPTDQKRAAKVIDRFTRWLEARNIYTKMVQSGKDYKRAYANLLKIENEILLN